MMSLFRRSLGIGRAVATLITSVFEVEVDQGKEVRFTPFPDVEELAKDYREAGDGTVEIPVIGRRRVTHPITQEGWREPFAKI